MYKVRGERVKRNIIQLNLGEEYGVFCLPLHLAKKRTKTSIRATIVILTHGCTIIKISPFVFTDQKLPFLFFHPKITSCKTKINK